MNNVSLLGRVVRDIELKYTGNGTAVANFTIAVDRRFKNADGEYDTDFIDIVVWRQSAEFVSEYFKKGSPIAVEGSIQTRNYENNEGRKVYVTEVVADNVGFVPRDNSQQQSQSRQTKPKKDDNPFANVDFNSNEDPFESNDTEINNSDLPF